MLFIHHFLFSERTFMLKVYQTFCAIWYCLYNLKNMKSTYGRIFTFSKFAGLHYSWKYHIRRNVNSFYCNYILIVSKINRSHQTRTLTFQKKIVIRFIQSSLKMTKNAFHFISSFCYHFLVTLKKRLD